MLIMTLGTHITRLSHAPSMIMTTTTALPTPHLLDTSGTMCQKKKLIKIYENETCECHICVSICADNKKVKKTVHNHAETQGSCDAPKKTE